MASLETTFLIDLLREKPAALALARRLEEGGEPKCVTAPAASEMLVGAYLKGGRAVEKARSLLGSLVLLEFDEAACLEAGQLGALLIERGEPMATPDLLIAAISKRHGQRVITRDRSFSRVPGLEVETY